jgi:outer membrane protein assembly factor BamA
MMRWTIRRTTCWIMLVLLALLPATARAQEPEEEFSVPWRTSWFPVLSGRSNDGPLLSLQIRSRQDAPYEARTTFTRAIDASAGATPQGSRYARATFDAPLFWHPWRFTVTAGAGREARFGYFGLGNETSHEGDLVTTAQPFFYRVKRTRYRGQAQASRYLNPRVLVALSGEVESSRFASLPGPSVFNTDFGPTTLKEDDASARLALVYDTRDVEYNTRRGLLLEAGVQAGSGGGNYTRLYTVLRGYLAIREGTVLAARLAGSGMGGRPTLNARFTIPAWDRPIAVLGGELSHRALDTGRLAGRHVLFGNVEVRHDLLNLGDLGAITLLGFADAGRVFESESFELTADDLKVGGGGGVALRILRSTIFTFNFAGGPDGFNFSVGNGWMF